MPWVLRYIFVMFLIGIVFGLICYVAINMFGAGAFKRKITMSGIYSVCKPEGYDVVCFLDADGKEGGMYCLPLNQVGGKCK